jgi:hypothetical protein
MDRFDEIREACRWVCERAVHVRVADERLDTYADSLSLEQIASPALDPQAHHIGHGEDTVSFFVVLDTINFGSGYFPHLKKLPNRSGYFTIATHLANRYRTKGPLRASELAALSEADCADLFAQDTTDPLISELMGLFARALNDLGTLLSTRFHGQATRLVESANARASRLIDILSGMPFFEDIEMYGGRQIPFFKRGQLLAADLALALGGKKWGAFEDLDRLTIFADNLVPHVLRLDGVLDYDSDLIARIARGEPIPAGSAEEVEIRAGAIYAVHRLVQRLRTSDPTVTEQRLDYLLWNRGQSSQYKAVPRHRTRTVFY